MSVKFDLFGRWSVSSSLRLPESGSFEVISPVSAIGLFDLTTKNSQFDEHRSVLRKHADSRAIQYFN